MVKLILCAALLIGALADERLLRDGYTHEKTPKGGIKYFKQLADDFRHSVVYFPDAADLAVEFAERMADRVKNQDKIITEDEYLNCNWGNGPDYFRFAPVYEGSAFESAAPVTFANHCFQENTAQITSVTEDSLTLTVTTKKKSSALCYDTYLIATINHYHLEVFAFEGTHKIEFKSLNANDKVDIQAKGVRIFTFCDKLWDLVVDLLMTVKLFAGGFSTNPNIPIFGSHTPEYMEKANIEFLKEAIGYEMKPRPIYKTDFDINEIKTGDFIAITRLDGLDEIIMYGSGSRIGHSTVAYWDNGELYVLESQDGWYWPKHGIQRNKFSEWIQWAENASFNVAVLPLKPEVRAKFNETAAFEWFKSVEGMPYGYHNFLFGWIDTANDNWPPLLDTHVFEIAFRLAEYIIPDAIHLIYNEALNVRLGTKGLNIDELEVEALKRGMTINDLMAMVEEEGIMYYDGYSYVCSSFVLAFYKRAGIFGDLELHATEFTPRDVYSLNIFDKNYDRPAGCKKADPELPYCQILGKYRIDLGAEYSTIEPYDHMDERCPSIAPNFPRPDGC